MKIESLYQLKKEKRKLRNECRAHEKDLAEQFDALQDNAGAIVVDTVIRAIPRLSISKIITGFFHQYTNKNNEGKEKGGGSVGKGLLPTLVSLGVMFVMKYFRRRSKK